MMIMNLMIIVKQLNLAAKKIKYKLLLRIVTWWQEVIHHVRENCEPGLPKTVGNIGTVALLYQRL